MLDHPSIQEAFTPEHHRLRTAALAYFRAEALAEWLGEPGGFLKKSQWHELGRCGFLGISLPTEHGGRGLGILGALIMNEAFSQLNDLGMTLGMHAHNEITSYWLATAHHEALRDRYLPKMLAGRLVGCACDTEVDGEMASTAVRDGNQLVVNGRKIYIINGYNADLCFVTLQLEGKMTTVLVEKERRGVRVIKVFDKLGTRSVDSALLEFDEVRVPASNAAVKLGVQQLMSWNKVMTTARFLMSADAYFLHGILLAKMLDYGATRQVAGKALLQWPINRRVIAGGRVDHELMRAGLITLFEKLQRKRNVVAEVAALKWFCVERAAGFAALCAEMHGGAGYMHDSDFLIAYAQLLGLRMAGGSSTTMKVIANGGLAYQEELQAIA